ncbi:hypothetical protein B0H10DRAFT_1962377 [Mycena sp. CBHHK59/15]|nr:hypothetical protein B0H10DRAFT_1962377 [Mycena sp. CBHHK59/15]
MERCYAEGLITFNTKAAQLFSINMLLKPISRGLKTLESTQVTCSDVFNIWIGITIGFQGVFSNPGMFILAYLLDPARAKRWWKAVSKDSNVYVLACLAIKLFSVVPSEMCDECMASKLTAYFGSSEVQQHCQKVWLGLPSSNCKPSDPIVAGIPTLRDLLNADSEQPINEETLFNHPDPYGVKDYEAMEEGEDDTDSAVPPLIIRCANLPVLEIETYIDLKAPKLTQCFAPDQAKPQQPVAQPIKKPTKSLTGNWTAEDTDWDAADW